MRPHRWVAAPCRALLLLLSAALAGVACSNRVCEAPDAAILDAVPRLLAETGLYEDPAAERIADDVRPFAPQFELWSDGATKRRWVYLPPGTRIDASDMDDWQFPTGTKLWKEFTRDDVRVETRMLLKHGPAPADWVGMAYVWNEDQTEAVAEPEGVIDALDTGHDVPAAGECFGCHGGRTSRVLGFSAIQLAHDAEPGQLDLADLVAGDRLDPTPASALAVPGDATERAALGYLHANCGHCHNQRRPTDDGPRCFDPHKSLDFSLGVDRLGDVEDTPTYDTAVGHVVSRGRPDRSRLIAKVSRRPGMPALGSERVDRDGVALLRRWIAEMDR